MARIDGVDDDLLAEAARAFGTTTERDTVDEALRRVVQLTRERRRRALDSLRQLVANGECDFARLDQLDT